MSKNKTVRKRFISNILSLLALFVVVCVPASFAAVASCAGNTGTSGTKYGTIDGACCAYYCSGTTIKKISNTNASYCASCSGVKYAPSGTCGTCEYKCCSDGNWSGCNQACPDPSAACSSTQCWNGTKCEDKPGTLFNGTCYYTWATCNCVTGSGWSCSGKNYQLYVTVTGSLNGTSASKNCQPSTNTAYFTNGITSPQSLCTTEKNAIGCSGTCTYKDNCRLVNGSTLGPILACEAKWVECE